MRMLIALGAFVVLGPAVAAEAATVTGVPRITSGNTFQLGSARYRLASSDAPPPDQLCLDAKGATTACGATARERLIAFSAGRSRTCETSRADRFGRTLAACRIGSQDVGGWLIREGLAVPRGPTAKSFAEDEAAAKGAKAGMWAGAFIAPREWRRRNRRAPVLGALAVPAERRKALFTAVVAKTPPSPDCAIKGNVNSAGQCIYHVPGGRWYARIRMDAEKGNRWFCSREAAELAGCRLTRR